MTRTTDAGLGARVHASTDADRDGKQVVAAVAAAKRGEEGGFRFLYVRYAADVYGFVRSIVRDDHEAEDVTQQVFEKLMAAIARYEPSDVPFKGWLLRVARNAALDHLRKRRAVPVEEVHAPDAAHEAPGSQRLGALMTALADLPRDQREVLVLRHVVGLSPSEIGGRLQKTDGAVHGLHHRGRRALKSALRELEVAPTTT
jgi:RNA polymerase sigma-70 factor (ECF subfamily)